MGLEQSHLLMQCACWVAAVEPLPGGSFPKIKLVVELRGQFPRVWRDLEVIAEGSGPPLWFPFLRIFDPTDVRPLRVFDPTDVPCQEDETRNPLSLVLSHEGRGKSLPLSPADGGIFDFSSSQTPIRACPGVFDSHQGRGETFPPLLRFLFHKGRGEIIPPSARVRLRIRFLDNPSSKR